MPRQGQLRIAQQFTAVEKVVEQDLWSPVGTVEITPTYAHCEVLNVEQA